MIEVNLHPDPFEASRPPAWKELLLTGMIVVVATPGVAGGAYVGSYLAPYLGCFGVLLLGFLGGVAAFALLIPVAFVVDRISERWRPTRPRCFAGACGTHDYAELPGGRWECACGQVYALDGERFGRVFDGEVVPYMRRDAKGRWVDDRPCR
jgi:hypothetical protein